LTDTQLRAAAVPVSGTFWQATQPVSGPLTDAQLRAAAVPVSGPVTDAQIRATALPVSGTFWQATQPVSGAFYQATQPVSGTFWQATQPVSGPLTNTELRASAVPVSGPITDAQIRASALPVSGPITDAQIRATALPVSGPLTNTELRAAAVGVAPYTAAITDYSFSNWPTTAARNDYSSSQGYYFTPTKDLTVSRLGRLYVAGNTQNHLVAVYNNTSQALVRSGTVLAASTSDGNGFKWVNVTPFTLTAGVQYAIAVTENLGGDTWKDQWSGSGYINADVNNQGYAYAGGVDQFPNNQSAGVNLYSTPAMMYTYNSTPTPYPVSGAFYPATQPVSGTFWQATQPVSGNVGVVYGTTAAQVTASGELRVTGANTLPKVIGQSGNLAVTTAAIWNEKAAWAVPATYIFKPKTVRAAVTTAGSRSLIAAGRRLATFNPQTNAFAADQSVAAPDFFDRLMYRIPTGGTAHSATATNVTATYTNQDGTAGRTTAALVIPASAAAGQHWEFTLAAGDYGVRAVTAVSDTAAPTTGTDEIWGLRSIHETLGSANSLEFLYLGEGVGLVNPATVFVLMMAAATTAQQRFCHVFGDLIPA
jgi:hypothetical protein